MPKFSLEPPIHNPSLTDWTLNDDLVILTRTQWKDVLDMFVAAGVSLVSFMAGIVATGANQATAFVLTKTNNRVDTVPTGTGVVEDVSAIAGQTKRTIQNRCGTGEDLLYYPFLGDNFFGLSANDPLTISDGNQVTVQCYTNGELTTI